MPWTRRAAPRHHVTVVSPHFDDVPLSLGQSLRDGTLRRCSVRVRVVFGRTNWTNWLHPTESRAPWVSRWRSVEETVAAARFGYRFTAAGWSEALLRNGDLDQARLLDPSTDLSGEPLVDEVARWLRRVLEADAADHPELLLVPAGLGGHVDHRIVALAAASLLRRAEVPIGFYEDRPYVAYLDRSTRDLQLSSLGVELEAVDVSGRIERSTQMRARQCYPSQMDRFFEAAMELDRDVDAVERVWFPVGACPEWFR